MSSIVGKLLGEGGENWDVSKNQVRTYVSGRGSMEDKQNQAES